MHALTWPHVHRKADAVHHTIDLDFQLAVIALTRIREEPCLATPRMVEGRTAAPLVHGNHS